VSTFRASVENLVVSKELEVQASLADISISMANSILFPELPDAEPSQVSCGAVFTGMRKVFPLAIVKNDERNSHETEELRVVAIRACKAVDSGHRQDAAAHKRFRTPDADGPSVKSRACVVPFTPIIPHRRLDGNWKPWNGHLPGRHHAS